MKAAHFDLSSQVAGFTFLNALSYIGAVGDHRGVNLHILCDNLRQKKDKDKAMGVNGIMARVNNVLVPLCRLQPKVRKCNVVTSASEANVIRNNTPRLSGKDRVTLDLWRKGHDPRNLTASPVTERLYFLNITQEWVIISLRHTDIQPERNSNVEAWIKFAWWLRENGFYPLIICDIDQPITWDSTRLRTFRVSNPAIRAALYERVRAVFCYQLGITQYVMHSKDTRFGALLGLRHDRHDFGDYQEQFARNWSMPWGEQPGFLDKRNQVFSYEVDDFGWIVQLAERILFQ